MNPVNGNNEWSKPKTLENSASGNQTKALPEKESNCFNYALNQVQQDKSANPNNIMSTINEVKLPPGYYKPMYGVDLPKDLPEVPPMLMYGIAPPPDNVLKPIYGVDLPTDLPEVSPVVIYGIEPPPGGGLKPAYGEAMLSDGVYDLSITKNEISSSVGDELSIHNLSNEVKDNEV
jgi:hypothetical protein